MVDLRFIVLSASLLSACESKYDVFMEGQKIEGAAERGPCKLHYTADNPAAVINGEMVAECLEETNKAIAVYEKAKAMGYDDADFTTVYERALERRGRLESMLEMVREMERDQDRDRALDKQPF